MEHRQAAVPDRPRRRRRAGRPDRVRRAGRRCSPPPDGPFVVKPRDLGRRAQLGAVRGRRGRRPPVRSSPGSTPRAARRWSSPISASIDGDDARLHRRRVLARRPASRAAAAAGDRDVFYLDEELGPAEATAQEREIAEAALACAPGDRSSTAASTCRTASCSSSRSPSPPLLSRVRGGQPRALRRGDRTVSLPLCAASAVARYSGCMSVRDTLGRPLRDLRISVTDRCNFRCVYCMPKEVFGRDYALPRPARAADLRGDRAAGARRSSRTASRRSGITGGEPLVRRDLERLIAHARARSTSST